MTVVDLVVIDRQEYVIFIPFPFERSPTIFVKVLSAYPRIPVIKSLINTY